MGIVAMSDAASRRPLPVKKRVQRNEISRSSSGVGGIFVDRRGERVTGRVFDVVFFGGVGTDVTILTRSLSLLEESGDRPLMK
jgi:hypothetical protein